jgi:hypothetical protein
MIRSIMIVAGFVIATVLVIVLQPGPRPDFGGTIADPDALATRNETTVLDRPDAQPGFALPDTVISDIKSANQPKAASATQRGTSGRPTPISSLEELQAVFGAQNQNVQVQAAPEPKLQPAPQTQVAAVRSTRLDTSVTSAQPVAGDLPAARSPASSELRDMSWQTLNQLSRLGAGKEAPGQQGSLLNSIVRRSMNYVDGAPSPRAAAPERTQALAAPQVQFTPAPVRQTGGTGARDLRAAQPMREYTVQSGDTLAVIAIKLFGSALDTDRILASNPELRQNPNSLKIGQVLNYAGP